MSIPGFAADHSEKLTMFQTAGWISGRVDSRLGMEEEGMKRQKRGRRKK